MFLISLLIARIATNRLAEVFAIAAGQGLAYRIDQTGIAKFWKTSDRLSSGLRVTCLSPRFRSSSIPLSRADSVLNLKGEDTEMTASRRLCASALAINGYITRMKDLGWDITVLPSLRLLPSWLFSAQGSRGRVA